MESRFACVLNEEPSRSRDTTYISSRNPNSSSHERSQPAVSPALKHGCAGDAVIRAYAMHA